MSTDAPTIEERYSRAMNSSRLIIDERTRGDVDILIAAGWTAAASQHKSHEHHVELHRRRRLAVSLYRLATEFDMVRAELHGRGAVGPTQMLMILSRLKTLAEAKELLGTYSTIRATKLRFMQPDDVVAQVTGRALALWMDPLCHSCEGRGFTGGYGAPRVVCKHCRGSGTRRGQAGKDAEERRFIGALLSEMDGMLAEVGAAMRTMLRS